MDTITDVVFVTNREENRITGMSLNTLLSNYESIVSRIANAVSLYEGWDGRSPELLAKLMYEELTNDYDKPADPDIPAP